MTPNSVQQEIVNLLLSSQKILIMASSPADGDCIGASLSLYLTLKKLDKEITVVCPDPIPGLYHFLPTTHVIGNRVVASKDFVITIDTKKVQMANVKSFVEDGKINIIVMPENGRLSEEDVSFNYGPDRYDLIITVDTGGLEQLGNLYANNIEMFHQIPVINIDHHFSNDHFGKVNLVDVMASATTELIIPLISMLEEQSKKELWDEDIATLLLTGIITDTGSFQNSNTTPRAFDASAQLISYGARQQEIIQHIFKTKQLTTLKLWGRILSKMQTDEKFHIVWSVLTRKDFADTGAEENETGGIIDELLSNAPGAEIICLLKEKKDGLISGSIRTTNPSVDASALAENFGGGGHTRAAGFKVTNMPVDKLEEQILKIFREYQSKRLGIPLNEEEVTVSAPPVVHAAPPVVHTPAPIQAPVISQPMPKPVIPPTPIPQTPVVPVPATPVSVPVAPAPIVEHPKPMVPPVAPPVHPVPSVPVAPAYVPPVAPPMHAPVPAPQVAPPQAPVMPPVLPQPMPAPFSQAQAVAVPPQPQPKPSTAFNFQEPTEPEAPPAAQTEGVVSEESASPSSVDAKPEEPKPEAPYSFGK